MITARDLAQLSAQEVSEILSQLSTQALETLYSEWRFWARPDQLTPLGDWNAWVILAGRGWGKTRTGAEDAKDYGLQHKNSRIAIVAPTYSDARDTCVEGDSGLLRVLPKDKIVTWNRSLGELYLTNGTKYKLFSASEPERLRGPQHHRAWCDELCAWQYPEAFDQLMFGLRLGKRPQVVITTTPKPTKLLKDLLKRKGKDVIVTSGSTFDNAANLAPAALEQLKARYLGSNLGRQELYAELLEDIEGALWNRAMLERNRVYKAPTLVRVVVGVDPAVTNNEESDETGIVVAGLGADGHAYVLADYTLKGSPLQWATEVVTAYHLFHADRVVAEVNNGGDLVEQNVKLVDEDISYKAVHASRGKVTRAEPVVALYEQTRVHHVGNLGKLEDEQCTWQQGMKSPNRLDALVWVITELGLNSGTIPIAVSSSNSPNPLPKFHTSDDEDENARLQAEQERRANIVGILQRLGGL